MRNEEKSKYSTLKGNSDLKHLPIHHFRGDKTMSEHEMEARVEESLEEDATPCSVGPVVRVSQDKEKSARLMKSAMSKNLRMST